MSLKAFHIFFIVAAASLSFGFGVWSLRAPGADRLMGDGSFIAGTALLIYLAWFLKKKVFR